MCDLCDRPDLFLDDVLTPIRQAVARHRFAVQGITGTRGRWPWERGHRARPAGQPLLGPRSPPYSAEHAPGRLDVPPHP